MKFASALISTLFASASAFAPSKQAVHSTQLHETKVRLRGVCMILMAIEIQVGGCYGIGLIWHEIW